MIAQLETLKEEMLIKQALQALVQDTDLKLQRVNFRGRGPVGTRRDAVAELGYRGVQYRINIEAKNVDRAATIILAQNRFKQFAEPGLLVVPYMTMELAEVCRKMKVQFADTAGNAYLNQKGLYLFITGKKPATKQPIRHPQNRIFNPPGLKVVFALLVQPTLTQATHRVLQQTTGVALGTVVNILNGLKQTGYLRELKNPTRRQLDVEKLIGLWVENYPFKLRPQCLIGRYHALDPNWWQKLRLKRFNALWGGEIAAAKLTHYLRPEVTTIYTFERVGKLLAAGRLRPDPKGEIEILTPFWKPMIEWPTHARFPDLVPPLLAYADLIQAGNGRGREVAAKIYDEYIRPTIVKT